MPADCCDGSDEPSGCPNTCLQASEGLKKSLRDEIGKYDQALGKRAEYVRAAEAARQSWNTRGQTLEQEIQKVKADVAELTSGWPAYVCRGGGGGTRRGAPRKC